MELVLWTYTFILKSLEYANKDAMQWAEGQLINLIYEHLHETALYGVASPGRAEHNYSICEFHSVTSDGPHHIYFLGHS